MSNIYDKLNDIEMEIQDNEKLTSNEVNYYFNTFKSQSKSNFINKKRVPLLVAAIVAAGLVLPSMNGEIQASIVHSIDKISYSFKDIITPSAAKYATHIN